MKNKETKRKAFVLLIVLTTFYSYAKSQQVYIDHVVAVVSDLEKTINYYSNKGFVKKKGVCMKMV